MYSAIAELDIMVSRNKLILSRDLEKSVLKQLLDAWGLSYSDFAKAIGVDSKTLWDYRSGRRGFKLDTPGMKSLDKLLAKIGLRLKDLPDDWILEKVEESEQAA